MFINFAQGFCIPPYWLNHPVHILEDTGTKPSVSEALGQLYQCPLRLKWQDEAGWWTLPFDPVLAVNGGNNIIRTDVLKQDNAQSERRGSIKEIWCQKDYEIQIAGLFMSKSEKDLPLDDLARLRMYCEARKVVEVECDLLEVFNIQRIAIETYEFVHTQGRQNQQFSIKAYSDDDFDLLVR